MATAIAEKGLALIVEDNPQHVQAMKDVINGSNYNWKEGVKSYPGPFELERVAQWVENEVNSCDPFTRVCLHLDLSWFPDPAKHPAQWLEKHHQFVRLLLCPAGVHIRLQDDELDDGLKLIKRLKLNPTPKPTIRPFQIVAVSTFGVDSLKVLAMHLGADYTVQKYPSLSQMYADDVAAGNSLEYLKARFRRELGRNLEDLLLVALRNGFAFDEVGQARLHFDLRELRRNNDEARELLDRVKRLLSFQLTDDGDSLPLDTEALKQDLYSYWDWFFNFSHYATKQYLGGTRRRILVELEKRVRGKSPATCRLRDDLPAYGQLTAHPLFLGGEVGTGKRHVAETVHALNAAGGKFVEHSFTAHDPRTASEEIFGAVEGFIPAYAGKLKAADGGTLFLEDIDAAPTEVLGKLREVIETGLYQPVGSSETITANVRLIMASHKNLSDEPRNGNLQRLIDKALRIKLLPLRERKEDIEELVKHFWEQSLGRHESGVKRIAGETREYLKSQNWDRSNADELETVVLQAMAIQAGEVLQKTTVEQVHQAMQP